MKLLGFLDVWPVGQLFVMPTLARLGHGGQRVIGHGVRTVGRPDIVRSGDAAGSARAYKSPSATAERGLRSAGGSGRMEPSTCSVRPSHMRPSKVASALTLGIGLLAACAAVGGSESIASGAHLPATISPLWHSSTYSNFSSFTSLIGYLSTEPLHDPCDTTRTPSWVTTSCAAPLDHLRSGGVFIQWRSWGMPGLRLANERGIPQTIDGHQARVFTGTADVGCAGLGGDVSVDAAIVQQTMNSHDQLLEMSACLRGPGTQQRQAAVQLMLTSVRLSR
jgi:hypothetical protein